MEEELLAAEDRVARHVRTCEALDVECVDLRRQVAELTPKTPVPKWYIQYPGWKQIPLGSSCLRCGSNLTTGMQCPRCDP